MTIFYILLALALVSNTVSLFVFKPETLKALDKRAFIMLVISITMFIAPLI